MFKNGMAGMMKKAQEMQNRVQQAQAEIKQLTATASVKDLIKVTINGEHQITDIKIADKMLDDKDMLQDLLLTVINDASQQITQTAAGKIQGATGGLNLPF